MSIFTCIYIFLAVLGLCCVDFSLVVETRGYSPAAVLGLPVAETSLVVKHMGSRAHGLQEHVDSVVAPGALEHRLDSCGKQA